MVGIKSVNNRFSKPNQKGKKSAAFAFSSIQGVTRRRTVTAEGARHLTEEDVQNQIQHIHRLTPAERLELQNLIAAPPPLQPLDLVDADDYKDDVDMMGDVLQGSAVMAGMSNAGGEFWEVLYSLINDLEAQYQCVLHFLSLSLCSLLSRAVLDKQKRGKDKRTRRDRTERRTRALRAQLPQLVDSYLNWSSSRGEDGLDNTAPYQGTSKPDSAWPMLHTLGVIDLFWRREINVVIEESDSSTASALIRQGLMPVATLYHTYAISIRALELFRVTRLRCPQLSTQAFVRSLNDMHLVSFPFSNTFLIANVHVRFLRV